MIQNMMRLTLESPSLSPFAEKVFGDGVKKGDIIHWEGDATSGVIIATFTDDVDRTLEFEKEMRRTLEQARAEGSIMHYRR